jgi:two-component system, NarL family, sensor histidine kinase ComP
MEGSYKHMGIAGIENRVLSLEGEVKVHSATGQGFQVNITLPTTTKQKGDYYGNIVG